MTLYRKSYTEILPSIHLNDDEALKKVKAPKYSLGRFSAIGEINNMYTPINKRLKTDIFDLIEQLSKSAYALFNALKNRRDPYTNLCVYSLDQPTKSQQVMFGRNLAELRTKGIVVKAKTINLLKPVQPHTYMINPYLLKALEKEEAEATWLMLTEGKVQTPTITAEYVKIEK